MGQLTLKCIDCSVQGIYPIKNYRENTPYGPSLVPRKAICCNHLLDIGLRVRFGAYKQRTKRRPARELWEAKSPSYAGNVYICSSLDIKSCECTTFLTSYFKIGICILN